MCCNAGTWCRRRLSVQVADFVQRLLRSQPFADAFQRAPGIAESVEWARAPVAMDTVELDPEVVVDTAILFRQRDDVAALNRQLAEGRAAGAGRRLIVLSFRPWSACSNSAMPGAASWRATSSVSAGRFGAGVRLDASRMRTRRRGGAARRRGQPARPGGRDGVGDGQPRAGPRRVPRAVRCLVAAIQARQQDARADAPRPKAAPSRSSAARACARPCTPRPREPHRRTSRRSTSTPP